jgi:hypothetical protein
VINEDVLNVWDENLPEFDAASIGAKYKAICSFNAKPATMKKPTLILLISVTLFPVLFSSCSGVGSTAGNGASSSATGQTTVAHYDYHPFEDDPDSGAGRVSNP